MKHLESVNIEKFINGRNIIDTLINKELLIVKLNNSKREIIKAKLVDIKSDAIYINNNKEIKIKDIASIEEYKYNPNIAKKVQKNIGYICEIKNKYDEKIEVKIINSDDIACTVNYKNVENKMKTTVIPVQSIKGILKSVDIQNNQLEKDPTFETDLVIGVRSSGKAANIIKGSYVVIPKSKVSSPFDMTKEEWDQTFEILIKIKNYIIKNYSPDGFNIGWNVGEVAGQSVKHAHLHIIPRYNSKPLAGKGIRYMFKQEIEKEREI